MYNNYYEEYIRNTLGYNLNPIINENQYSEDYFETEYDSLYNNQEVEEMYPDIYKKIYPIICKHCMNVRERISEDLINRITDEVYKNIDEIEENKELQRENNRNVISNNNRINPNINNTIDKRNNPKNCNNCVLKDLIKILILRELLGNPVKPVRPPMRPPMKPPIRPPFESGPMFNMPYMM